MSSPLGLPGTFTLAGHRTHIVPVVAAMAARAAWVVALHVACLSPILLLRLCFCVQLRECVFHASSSPPVETGLAPLMERGDALLLGWDVISRA